MTETADSPDSALQLQFVDTTIDGVLALDIGNHQNAEWRESVRRLLDAVAAERGGPASLDVAWEDMLAWLHDGGSLEAFLRRSLQTVDASLSLLTAATSVVLELLQDPGREGEGDAAVGLNDVLALLQRRVEEPSLQLEGRRSPGQ